MSLPDWRRDGPAYFELDDLTGVSFQQMYPEPRRGVVLPQARRPYAEPAPERLLDRASRVLVVLALAGLCWIALGAVVLVGKWVAG